MSLPDVKQIIPEPSRIFHQLISIKSANNSVRLNSFFVNIFSTNKARDSIQTVLESAWNKNNYYSNIDLKLNYA